jgi:ABC-type glycerol-3-phosphate transport system substrate-binding protein
MSRILAGVAALVIALSAGPGFAQEKLTVWWIKGFYKAEDEALFAAIRKFETRTGVKVDLSQYAAEDMIPKTAAALESGSPPDIAYSDTYDVQVAARWAFDGKLEDISDVIEPMRDRFLPLTIESAYLYDGKAGKKAVYGFVLKQQMLHVAYWKDMLATAGYKENDIPGTWKEYWTFWCDKVQPAYRKATSSRVHGIGRPMGVDSTDSFQSFMSWVDALRRQAGRWVRQAGGRRSQGPGRADLRLARLHRRLCQGLLAALVDGLEGRRQRAGVQRPHDDPDPRPIRSASRRSGWTMPTTRGSRPPSAPPAARPMTS